jgi:hypothetical protein
VAGLFGVAGKREEGCLTSALGIDLTGPGLDSPGLLHKVRMGRGLLLLGGEVEEGGTCRHVCSGQKWFLRNQHGWTCGQCGDPKDSCQEWQGRGRRGAYIAVLDTGLTGIGLNSPYPLYKVCMGWALRCVGGANGGLLVGRRGQVVSVIKVQGSEQVSPSHGQRLTAAGRNLNSPDLLYKVHAVTVLCCPSAAKPQ